MKVIRLKKAQKIISFYTTNFGYREPFQIIIDGTFCNAALEGKISIEEQMQRYLQSTIKPITTQCIILEVENLALLGVMLVVKNFIIHKCGHEGKPVSGNNCIQTLVKNSKYLVATQDRVLQNYLRRIPGQALIYLHKSTPVLEQPSEATKKSLMNKTKKLFRQIEKKAKQLKSSQGIISDDSKKKKYGIKRKNPKYPNPLSCKKKKLKKN